MAVREIHKGRASWTRWADTPSLLAAIAHKAEALVGDSGIAPVPLTIKVESRAWESEFPSGEAVVEGLG